MVVGHTDCGLQSVDEGEIRDILLESLEEEGGGRDGADGDERDGKGGRDFLDTMQFGSFIS